MKLVVVEVVVFENDVHDRLMMIRMLEWIDDWVNKVDVDDNWMIDNNSKDLMSNNLQ